MFVNDMPSVVEESKIGQYADDTVVYYSARDADGLEAPMNRDLDRLSVWCRQNKMHVNGKKTKYLVLGSRNKTSACRDINLSIGGTSLERVKTFKYLGITLDSNLTFESHIAHVNRTVRHKTFLLRVVRPYLTTFAAMQVLKVMISPLLEYGAILYDSAAGKHTHKLQVAMNSGIRAVFQMPRLTPTTVLYDKAGFDPITLRRQRAILIHAYHRSKIDKHVDHRGIQTRNHSAVALLGPQGNSKFVHDTLDYKSATLWNALPNVVKNAESLVSYKTRLGNHLKLRKKQRIPHVPPL